jgi:DNA repair exonuclease SbcCD ATPase subunit/DNA repair exonuclease SbcCD nuclease subunit
MIKLAHLSDTHIKLLRDHNHYSKIFDKLYEKLKEEKPYAIIHCGDLFHNKTNLTPEAVKMAGEFLNNLANIAPTYIIAGNHDLNLKNGSRLDSITPVVDFLNHPNLHYIKKAGEVQIGNNIVLNSLVINDEDNWSKISDPNKINIALYHGSVSGVQTDMGYVMDHGDHDIGIFEGFDYCFLGDIHKTNQVLDTEGRVRYPGSTVQQNFGETNDKGFLIWNIEDKDTFSVDHFSIPHPSPFVTIELTPDGNLPEDCLVQEGAKLRLVSNNHISLQALKKAVDIAKTRFKPDSVTVQNKPGKRISVEELTNEVEHENLRDVPTQEKLISEYLKDYKLDENVLSKVFEFNRKYNTIAEQSDDIARNVHWKLKNIEWSNLFNYGKDNSVDFSKINGVLGIFGKNYSGKSSIVDSILWTMFNSISKNVRKNVDIINQNRQDASAKVEIEIDNKVFTINRQATKYTKKLHGEETVEAKTSLDFSSVDNATGNSESLNGLDRNETDANIRRVFGSIDDFLLTSMTSQVGSLAFINEGSTKRKEILGKFLDLEHFDKKFKLAKDESALLKGAIKRLEGKDFDSEISKTLTEITDNEILTERNKTKCSSLKQQLEACQNELSELKAKVSAGPKQEFIDLDKVLKDISLKEQEESELNNKSSQFQKELEKREGVLVQLNEALSKYDYEKLKLDKKALEDLNKKAVLIESAVQMLQKQKKDQQKQISILDNVPCGDSFLSCKFLVDAAKQRELVPDTEKKLLENESLLKEVEEKIKNDETLKHINKFEQLNNNLHLLDKEVSDFKLKIEKNKGQIVACQKAISELRVLEKTYHENEAWMKQLHDIKESQKEINKKVVLAQSTLDACETDTNKLYREHGSLVNKKETLEREKLELVNLRDEFLAYDLFSRAMHSNGIVYDIIKKRLPVINQEIAKVLSNIVNFEIYFEDDGKKLDIYIRHPKYDPRPIELGSGAEKSIAAIAIRLALIKVSNLPVGDIFILDEPATALDEENMEGFVRIIDMIKTQFKTVILISHLEALKDIVDDQIIIESVDGFAKVNI